MFIKSMPQDIDKNDVKNGKKDDEEHVQVQDKNNIGIIKCVDITKLMKPTLVEKTKPVANDSIILLSSDSETDAVGTNKKEIVPSKKRKKTRFTVSDSEDDDDFERARPNKKLRSAVKSAARVESFACLRKNRENRLRTRQNSNRATSVVKKPNEYNLKECYVSLPKIPVELLKDFYLNDKADSIIKSLTKKEPMKRLRGENSESEEEPIRFPSRKETMSAATKKTRKTLKRLARLVDSDSSSNEGSNKNEKSDDDKYKQSSSESESKSESGSGSDSDAKKPVRRRIKRMQESGDDSSEDEAVKKTKDKNSEDQNTRKKIRNVWNKDSLADATKAAAKEEEDRKKRIAERQKLYNDMFVKDIDENAKVEKVVLDFNEETKEELLSVHEELAAKLKPHQAKGVQFMWTACFESLERTKSTEGSGCILAHCMGLGKTLQVITLIHTLLTHADKTDIRTVLVVCPLSTVLNWVSEFKKWLDDIDSDQVNVFDLIQYKQNYERLHQLKDWLKFGGVMVLGYNMFRNLANPKGKSITKKMAAQFKHVLLETGPDLVICDEGHLLKNEKTGISIAMNQLKTKRRIVLTGTPLQNNLKEYFCMVQFVKPNLLGTYKEYLNRFVNPITNGQYTDSTDHDIQIMRRRAHVLHKMLDAIVDRKDYNVLAPFLPPKHEYVLFIKLTPVQIKLYEEYLRRFARNALDKGGNTFLFSDFQEFQRICIHPRVLLDKSNQDKLKRDLEDDDEEEGSLKDFIDDGDEESANSSSSNESESNSDSDSKSKKSVPARRTRSNPLTVEDEKEQNKEEMMASHSGEWWSKFCPNDELDHIDYSTKIKLLFDILHKCELIGDKILIFSQSLYSLNLIEYFLARVDEATHSGDSEALKKVGGYPGNWDLGLDYFRLDGSTSCENRALWCSVFNNESNTRARLFLISTRAGGLGINLVAANRVIIFDVSWNPSYDVQSIYRVYRFGQTKPCYIYRFVTLGTMENKIYERQVTKQAISKRVIDAQQIDRHYNQNDLAELYAFNPVPDEPQPVPILPKDRLFADLLQTYPTEIFKYHEHNSLLEDKADEGLNEEERKAAWEEFENEKKAPEFNLARTMVRTGMYETLRVVVQQDNPTWTPAQVNNSLVLVIQKISEQIAAGDYTMYRRLEEKHRLARVNEQMRMQMIYQKYLQQLNANSHGNPLSNFNLNQLSMGMGLPNMDFSGFTLPGTSSSTMNQTTAPTPHPTITEVIDLND